MNKKKEVKRVLQIQFPKIEEMYFSGSSVIDDFETFLEYAHSTCIRLSRTEVISVDDCKALNSILAYKIIVPFSRPLPKSFPNVINLFILFRISGLAELTTKGKYTALKVNSELYEQWKNFTVWEKYFNLLAVTLDNFSFEFINEDSRLFKWGRSSMIEQILKKKKLVYDKQISYHFDSFDYKCIWVLYEQFGFVNVSFFEPEEGKKTIIETIMLTDWGNTFFTFLLSFDNPFQGLYFVETDNETYFKDAFTKGIPQVKNYLKIPDNEKVDGLYTFIVKLGNAKRSIIIDSSNELDELCYFILKCFDFDYDHMYMVTVKDRFGKKVNYNGCPDMSYVDSPTTEDITIGELAIRPCSKMEYIYDFGDNWKFEITLESISKRQGNKIMKKPELIKSTGKPPQQYYY